jgi:hypothetical protein
MMVRILIHFIINTIEINLYNIGIVKNPNEKLYDFINDENNYYLKVNLTSYKYRYKK